MHKEFSKELSLIPLDFYDSREELAIVILVEVQESNHRKREK